MNIAFNMKQLFSLILPFLRSRSVCWITVILFALRQLQDYQSFAGLPADQQQQAAFDALWKKDPAFVTAVGPEKLLKSLPHLLSLLPPVVVAGAGLAAKAAKPKPQQEA